ncbi:hypothetical protein V2J09_001925 [Rumex salicifolius]
MILSIGDKAVSSLSLFPYFNSRAPLVLSPRPSHIRPILLNYSSALQISPYTPKFQRRRALFTTTLGASPAGSSVEHLAGNDSNAQLEENWESTGDVELERFNFDKEFESTDLRKLTFSSPSLEVKELQELPENWRRSRLAWLCKELPAHKRPTMTRLLNAQKKWIKQEDATYVAVHCMRIRENEAGFWVYKWMIQQHWFYFDFSLATKLADYMGRERKYAKCREIFDDIINQGRVPSESTFHLLIIAYLSTDSDDCTMEACEIYNRMIQLGGYRPRLSLHNSLFRALVTKPGSFAKKYLKQAEFIFHNLVTSEFEIHRDIYGGLIWLHSYQDTVDIGRISSLRKEMKSAGFEESQDVLLSILRSCSKVGDVEEAEETWFKLQRCDIGVLSQGFIYRMEAYANAKQPMKSFEIFKEMEEQLGSVNVMAYHKIMKVLCQANNMELAESVMKDFIQSKLKPLAPSYINLMTMYFRMRFHDKVESTFADYLQRCQPNRTIYSIYLDSLVHTNNIEMAERVFNQMLENGDIGVTSRSCNTMMKGYLCIKDDLKAEKLYQYMRQKKYEVDSTLDEEIDLILISRKKTVDKPLIVKLSQDQREMLVGMSLGGLRIESDDGMKQHYVQFDFKDGSTHRVLKRHIHDQFREWLHPSSLLVDDDMGEDNLPTRLFTVPHAHFSFYADLFWSGGRPTIPKLVHRWLSSRALAYWYMYGGYRTSSGDIVLKLKGSVDGVERVIRGLRAKALDVKVKQKGRVFWLGFVGRNSESFWQLVEPYVLEGLKDLLRADAQGSDNALQGARNGGFGTESDQDESSDEGGSTCPDNNES